MPVSRNRTKWPLKGGAVSIQPGWFQGHSLAMFHINMGYGNEPLNYSHIMLPVFQITGPTNLPYNGTFCLPQVPLPANFTPAVGDNATIQVIEVAQHGASLYNVCFRPLLCSSVSLFSAPPSPSPLLLRLPLLCSSPSPHAHPPTKCADITFSNPEDVAEVNSSNCFNTTQPDQKIGFRVVYTATSSRAPPSLRTPPAANAQLYATVLATVAVGVFMLGAL